MTASHSFPSQAVLEANTVLKHMSSLRLSSSSYVFFAPGGSGVLVGRSNPTKSKNCKWAPFSSILFSVTKQVLCTLSRVATLAVFQLLYFVTEGQGKSENARVVSHELSISCMLSVRVST